LNKNNEINTFGADYARPLCGVTPGGPAFGGSASIAGKSGADALEKRNFRQEKMRGGVFMGFFFWKAEKKYTLGSLLAESTGNPATVEDARLSPSENTYRKKAAAHTLISKWRCAPATVKMFNRKNRFWQIES
jgi:hypothetical protein